MPRILTALAALLLLAPAARADGVAVELLEGPFAERSWDLAAGQVTERYAEGAFAFPTVPAKFSPRGVVLDRSNPFVLRATQTLSLPAADYRLLLRARGAARFYLDGKLLLEHDFLKLTGDGHGSVPPRPQLAEPTLRPPLLGQRDKVIAVALDGKPHEFRVEIVVGAKNARPRPVTLSSPSPRPGSRSHCSAATPRSLRPAGRSISPAPWPPTGPAMR